MAVPRRFHFLHFVTLEPAGPESETRFEGDNRAADEGDVEGDTSLGCDSSGEWGRASEEVAMGACILQLKA